MTPTEQPSAHIKAWFDRTHVLKFPAKTKHGDSTADEVQKAATATTTPINYDIQLDEHDDEPPESDGGEEETRAVVGRVSRGRALFDAGMPDDPPPPPPCPSIGGRSSGKQCYRVSDVLIFQKD